MTRNSIAKIDRMRSVAKKAGDSTPEPSALSMSVGIAIFPEDGKDAEDLLAEADRRMYKSKRLRKKGTGVRCPHAVLCINGGASGSIAAAASCRGSRSHGRRVMTANGFPASTNTLARRLVHSLLSLILAVLCGGFIASALVRYSPGFEIDENSWNPQISARHGWPSMPAASTRTNCHVFTRGTVVAALHGDFGDSDSFHVPVTELLRERAGVTTRLIVWGVLGGMLLGGWLAWLAVWPRRTALEVMAVSTSGLLLAVPPAVLALAFFLTGAPLAIAVAFAILPRVFGTMRALWNDLYRSGALLAARARGMAPGCTSLAIRSASGRRATHCAERCRFGAGLRRPHSD